MTINIALVTREALILGCDSIASASEHFIDPWRHLDRDDEGNPQQDANGQLIARFKFDALRSVVTDAWGGATKMFGLSRDNSWVAATTAGLSIVNEQKVSAIAAQFARSMAALNATTVDAVAVSFMEFVRQEYEKQYSDPAIPDEWKNEVEFLVGGYGSNDNFPSLYRVSVRDRQVSLMYGPGHFGIAWAGQADAVARLVHGYDRNLRDRVNAAVRDAMSTLRETYSSTVARIVQDVLEKGGVGAEELAGVDTSLPDVPNVQLPFHEFALDIEIANLSLQDAVELVSYLVNLQAGRMKFGRGVATVGGRTHVGIATRDSFRMLNEPEIIHRHTGFNFEP